MTPKTQKALVSPTPRAPWELRTDWLVPAPGPKELLIKVVAAALNPADWRVQTSGIIPFVTYPFLGGLDGAGIIEEVGTDVTGFAKGDKVLCPGGFGTSNATFQQYHVATADNTAKIPDNITFEQAAAVPLGLATAICSLWSHHPEASTVDIPAPWEEGGKTKYAGQPALVVGGSSSVGQYAIQALRFNGFSPIITTSSLKHTEYLQSLGATHVLDRAQTPDALLAHIHTLADGAVALGFDAIGAPDTQRLAYTALRAGGGCVTVVPPGLPMGAPLDELQRANPDDGKRVGRAQASLGLPRNRALGVELYKRLEGWLADGTIVPNRVEVLPSGLGGIADGLKRMQENKVSGVKLVVRVEETA